MEDFVSIGTQKRIKASPYVKFKQWEEIREWGRGWAPRLSRGLIVFVIFLLSVGGVWLWVSKTSNFTKMGAFGVLMLEGNQKEIRTKVAYEFYNLEKGKCVRLEFPDGLLVRTGNSGMYPISALYGLYALDRRSVVDYMRAMMRNVRLEMVGVARLRERSARSLLLMDAVTNLGLADRLYLASLIAFRKGCEKVELPLEITRNLDPFDGREYDEWVGRTLEKGEVRKEALTVAIVNSSKRSKLGSTVGRILSSLGLNVVSIQDGKETNEVTMVTYGEERLKETMTAQVLKILFPGSVKVEQELGREYRSMLVVTLGKDILQDITP